MNASSKIILAAVMLALTGYTYTLNYRKAEEPQPPALERVPAEIAGYRGRDEPLEPASLRLLGADATLFRTYSNEKGRRIWLFLGYFGSQQQNSQIHSPKHCYPGAGWNVVYEGSVQVRLADGSIRAKELMISDGKERRIVLYWFSTYSGIITDEFALKWHQMKSSLLGRTQATAFVRFSMPVTAGEEGPARADLLDFVEAVSTDLQSALTESLPPRDG